MSKNAPIATNRHAVTSNVSTMSRMFPAPVETKPKLVHLNKVQATYFFVRHKFTHDILRCV
jgi:hypothetical protein